MAKWWVGVALLVAVVAALLLWRGLGDDEPPGPRPGVERPDRAPAPEVVLRGASEADRVPKTPPSAAVDGEGGEHGATVLVRGRVADPRHQAVAGARVAVYRDEVEVASTTSGDDGAFRLRVPVPDEPGPVAGRVNASDDLGRVAVEFLYLTPGFLFRRDEGEAVDVRTLVLAPAHTCDVLVKAPRSTTGVAHVEVQSESASGMGVPVASFEVPIGEVASLPPLPAGVCRLVALAEGFGRGVAGTRLPREEESPVVVELTQARAIDVLVVDASTEKPVEGAHVTVHETVPWAWGNVLAPYRPDPVRGPTNAEGTTRLEGLAPADRLTVSVQAEGYEAPDLFGRNDSSQRVPAGTTELRFALRRLRTGRWPIEAGEHPVPADGTAIRLRAQEHRSGPFPETGRVEAGHLVIDGFGWDGYYFLAVAPDGAIAVVRPLGEADEGRPIVFEAPRSFEIVLHDETGAAVSGMRVTLQVGGYRSDENETVTDPDGFVRFEGLPRVTVTAHAGERDPPFATWLGTVDLANGDGRLEATLWREREVVVHLRVQGKPALPEKTYVQIAGLPLEEASYDIVAGTVRGRWRPYDRDEEVHVEVKAPGFRPARVAVRRADSPPHELTVDLEPAGQLLVLVDMPQDKRCRLQLQRYDASIEAWLNEAQNSGAGGAGQTLRVDASGSARLDALAVGRYRIVDQYACLASDAVDVTPGVAATAHLDLSKSGYAQGVVLGPDGQPVVGAGVRLVDGPLDVARTVDGGNAKAAEDGRFWFRVPGDRPVTIEATHPVYRAAREGGRLQLREAREGLVLRLEPGRSARVTFDRPIQAVQGRVGLGWKNLRLYRGAVGGTPVLELDAPVDGTALTFGGYEPDRYTVWVDAYPYAPVVLEDVDLTDDGVTEIGPVKTSEGAKVVLTVLREPEAARQAVFLHAFHRAAPGWIRQLRGQEDVLTLSGLGPGTVEVQASTGPSGVRWQETLEIQGGETIERTLDLR